MQTKFSRHQIVKLIRKPNPDYVEYHPDLTQEPIDSIDSTPAKLPEITSGMKAKINILLPNGKYHIEILNDKDEIIAYAMVEEDDLESL